MCYPISHECVWSQLQAMFVSHTEPNAINVSAHGAVSDPGRGAGVERPPRVTAGTCQQPVSITAEFLKVFYASHGLVTFYLNLSEGYVEKTKSVWYGCWTLMYRYSLPQNCPNPKMVNLQKAHTTSTFYPNEYRYGKTLKNLKSHNFLHVSWWNMLITSLN